MVLTGEHINKSVLEGARLTLTFKIMSDVNKIKNEVNKADAEMKGVKEINYHKYNNYVMGKTMEFNKALKEDKVRNADRIAKDSAVEATKAVRILQGSKTSFLFSGLDRLK